MNYSKPTPEQIENNQDNLEQINSYIESIEKYEGMIVRTENNGKLQDHIKRDNISDFKNMMFQKQKEIKRLKAMVQDYNEYFSN